MSKIEKFHFEKFNRVQSYFQKIKFFFISTTYLQGCTVTLHLQSILLCYLSQCNNSKEPGKLNMLMTNLVHPNSSLVLLYTFPLHPEMSDNNCIKSCVIFGKNRYEYYLSITIVKNFTCWRNRGLCSGSLIIFTMIPTQAYMRSRSLEL